MHLDLLDHLIIGAGDQVYGFADRGDGLHPREFPCRRLLGRTD